MISADQLDLCARKRQALAAAGRIPKAPNALSKRQAAAGVPQGTPVLLTFSLMERGVVVFSVINPEC